MTAAIPVDELAIDTIRQVGLQSCRSEGVVHAGELFAAAFAVHVRRVDEVEAEIDEAAMEAMDSVYVFTSTASSLRVAGTGPRPIRCGSTPAAAARTTRARGVSP